MSWPNTRIEPLVGSISPIIMPMVVVLPAPLPPSNPVVEPTVSEKESGPTAMALPIGLAEAFDDEGDV